MDANNAPASPLPTSSDIARYGGLHNQLSSPTSLHSSGSIPIATTALKLSLWSVAGVFANARSLARVEGDVEAVRNDVSEAFQLLDALRKALYHSLDAARSAAQRLDDVERSQAHMDETLAECTAQLRRSRASLSQLDTRLQALLSARIRSDAVMDAAALYIAFGLLRGLALPFDSAAWVLGRTVFGRAGSRAGGGRLLALLLRGIIVVSALRALRAAALRAGLHSGVGGPSSYLAEIARWAASQQYPSWMLKLVTLFVPATTPANPPSTPTETGSAASADNAASARVAAASPDDDRRWSPAPNARRPPLPMQSPLTGGCTGTSSLGDASYDEHTESLP